MKSQGLVREIPSDWLQSDQIITERATSGSPVITPSETGAWDDACIHDPYPLIYKGLIWLFYKGQNNSKGENGYLIRAHGVATSDNPEGPFEKSVLNPISNSGHETCLWPYKEGIATLVSLDGPEKNTIQFAKDGLNYEIKSIMQSLLSLHTKPSKLEA